VAVPRVRVLMKTVLHVQAVILVVDSTDTERLHITKSELHKMMQNEVGCAVPRSCRLANAFLKQQLSQSLLLVYANKQDLKKALSSAEISDALSLTSLDKKIQWHIQVWRAKIRVQYSIVTAKPGMLCSHGRGPQRGPGLDRLSTKAMKRLFVL